MPKAVEIEAFAAKLELVCKRLNWSRGRLAQQVGIDKSLVGRWLGGGSRPTGNTLMRLNEAVARALPDFSAALWDLPPADLAGRLGIVAVPSIMPSPSVASAHGPLSVGAIAAGLRTFARTASDIDTFESIYAGFYRLWFCSFGNDGIIRRRAGWIRHDGNALRFDAGGATGTYSGEGVTAVERLYLIGENRLFEGLAIVAVRGAHRRHPSLLTGVTLFHSVAHTQPGIAVAPTVLEYLAEPSGDPVSDAATWASLAADEGDYPTDKTARAAVPADILRLLRSAVAAPRAGDRPNHILVVPPLA